jgi:hypothetical protein
MTIFIGHNKIMVSNVFKTPYEMLLEISNIMDANIRAFDSGNDVDMNIFDEKVRSFCEVLSKLSAHEARQYEDKLKQVIDKLTDFIPKLEAQRDALGEKITSMNKRNVAYNAYGNALILAMQSANSDD